MIMVVRATRIAQIQLTLTITLSRIAESPLITASSPGIDAFDTASLATPSADFVMLRMSSTFPGFEEERLIFGTRG